MLSMQESLKQIEFEEEVTAKIKAEVYRELSFMTHNSENAEELLQETLFKAFKSWESYKKGTNVKAWISRIAQNNFKNWYKSEKAKTTVPLEQHQWSPIYFSESLADPYRACFTALLMEEIRKAADQLLSINQSSAISLCDFFGHSYEDAAGILGIPVGTIKSSLHHGRVSLRFELMKRGYNSDHADTNFD